MNNIRLFFWRLRRCIFHHNEGIKLCERYQLKMMINLKPNERETKAMREQIERTIVRY